MSRPVAILGFACALLFAALAGIVPVSLVGSVHAQSRPSSDIPVLLSADEVLYNEDLGLVTASGKVEISQGDRVLQADSVTYNQKTNVVTASGNVSMLEPKGEVVFAEYIELTDDMKDGVARGFGILLQDGARLAGSGARLSGGTRRELANAVYSPCELCPKNPSRAPLWQVKAVRVIHDTEAKEVTYKDARLELFGVPIAYTPYLSHPDPTVKRKSGLLAPSFGNDSELGLFVKTPYFVVIDDDKDATIEPMFTTRERAAGIGQYRQRFDNGSLQTDGSLTYVRSRDPNGNVESGDRFRGHLFATSRFDLDPTWRAGYDGGYVSDDTYLRRYKLSSQSVVTNHPFVEGYRGNNYAALQAYHFRGLRQRDSERTTPFVLPLADYNFVGDADDFGGRILGDANLMALHRQEGADSRRLSTRIGWTRPYTTQRGDIWTTSFTWQNDVYAVEDVATIGRPRQRLHGATGRSIPQARLDWRYPFVREMGAFRNVVEPMAAVIVAPNGGNPAKIPNEDSVDFEFDDTNLFSTNRFTGLDRVETSQRAIYGMKVSALGNKGGLSELFFGQSYRFRQDDTFEQGSGLDTKLSDYVGRLRLAPAEYLDGLYRFRNAQSNFTPVRHEVLTRVGPRALRLNVNYLFFKQTTPTSEFGDREQIGLGLSSQFTERWAGRISHTRNLRGRDEGALSSLAGVTYEDECLLFDVAFSRNFTHDRDFRTSDSFLFRILFKTLGEVKTSAR